MPPELTRTTSQGSIVSQTTQHMGPLSRPGTADPIRARSENLSRAAARRPRSRGSTASIHSSTTQQTQDQHLDVFPQFLPSQVGGGQHIFGNNPEDMLMRFGHHLSHQPNGAPLDPNVRDTHSMASRSEEFHAHGMHGHGIHHQAMPADMPHSAITSVAMPQYQGIYDSGIENHLPDHPIDEQEASEPGGKKKRGTNSTLANDNELRKLLRQYEGFTLKQMAAEVMKHEGAGGKAEKVKQVFAMIWLRENCRKSNGSVRRDRVYCCYAEKCGTERVSVLNPASFGKLVRIIFPNVQTRRLGVRGESKYHYVDLSVIEEKQQRPVSLDGQAGPNHNQMSSAPAPERPASGIRSRSISVAQPTADTAVFPSPTTSFAPRFPTNTAAPSGACATHSPNAAITTENVSQQAARMVHEMLQFPTDDVPNIDNESLVLPDIRGYLPVNTDPKVADALAALYRSHCISVIDSFRFCKERNLLKYFSAFHGTLTVPVQKLLTHPNLAPWIKECDWLMYQKMIAFVAPLTTQVVPKVVLDAFSSISQRLCSHIAETFKAQPSHVSVARLLPAHIFCHLLKHMLDVNQSANAAAAWLCHPDNRNQMWFDFKSLVNPPDMIMKANIPPCSDKGAEQILKHDVRALLTPVNDTDASVGLPFFSQPDGPEAIEAHQLPVETSTGDDYNFPDKWIAFILNLPLAFPNHSAQGMIEKIDALWDTILHRLTLGGAASFSAWWMTKVFFREMMIWQAEKGGFMRNTATSLQIRTLGPEQIGMGNFQVKQNPIAQPPTFETVRGANSKIPPSHNHGSMGSRSTRDQTVEIGSETKEIPNAKELAFAESGFQPPNHDDSAIDLEDDAMLMAVGKYGDMMVSDPADAEGDVIVI
ncbi:DNA damage and replication checkpoint protein rfx1-like protein [Penicillium ucsense]|uniref:DNA damage and replication checkpoint protein rfx1-like protein n=1 Tax=Penicillium ucsense TaxID=2839758 RepID=A0A8J8VVW3_9EURO|nr:DNA damage and replication checkpoint protein rfx1-like protein [Penicillium ucsense]KAF7729282.1 DNA damage and replication checkpoint protein rfx1-like protein [Penicillium ucsense]